MLIKLKLKVFVAFMQQDFNAKSETFLSCSLSPKLAYACK